MSTVNARYVAAVLATVGFMAAAVAGTAAPVNAAPAQAVPAHGAPAQAAPADQNCAAPGRDFKQVPWAQQVLAPERVTPFSRGANVKVAVLDSGVDGNHPQLSGRVDQGFDAVASKGRADDDCIGTGTQVAGVIAAKQVTSIGFFGLAPGATIVPVRVIAKQAFGSPQVDAAVLARGIDWAVTHGVDVIDVSVACYVNDPAVRTSVANALANGVVVVAAVGDQAKGNPANPTPYPAAYDGVLGVGAVDATITRWPASQVGSYVDLVAPGVAVTTLQRGGGIATEVDGTGVASGFVAATAALVRAKQGKLQPATVSRVLRATATPAALGPNSPEYGRGLVNPYAAVNEHVATDPPAALPALVRPGPEPPSVWTRTRGPAMVGTAGAVLVVLAVLGIAAALPRGRRRFWRPAIAPLPPSPEEPEEPSPPIPLFADER